MSTQRFDIRHAPAPRESFRLLYISKSRFGGDWNSTAHTLLYHRFIRFKLMDILQFLLQEP